MTIGENPVQSSSMCCADQTAIAITRINHEILGSVSRSFYDPDRKLLYAAINRPATVGIIQTCQQTSAVSNPQAQ